MNWVRNYFTPLTFLCSARHAGATSYCAAPSSAALHSCPPWQPLGPHPAVQRLRARRHTCNVQRLALRRCTVTYMQPPRPSPPPTTPLHQLQKKRRRRPSPLPLSIPSPKSFRSDDLVRGFLHQSILEGTLLRSPSFYPYNVCYFEDLEESFFDFIRYECCLYYNLACIQPYFFEKIN